MHKYTLLCADMAGTTVRDDGVVDNAAATALRAVGLHDDHAHDTAMRHVRGTMGQSKIEVFRAVLGDEELAQHANTAFEKAIDDSVATGAVTPLPQAAHSLARLRQAGIKIAITTGFAPETQWAILRKLGWTELMDLAVAPDQTVRGRPFPDMILHAALRLGVDDVRRIAVVGDSVNDVSSGLRAGAGLVAGVTTGAHDGDALRQAGATGVYVGLAQLADAIIDAPAASKSLAPQGT